MDTAQKTTRKKNPATRKTAFFLSPVSMAVRPIVKKFLPQKCALFQQLFTIWPDLVMGTEAEASIPEKLAMARGKQNEGQLHLWAQSGAQAMEISFNKRNLISRINKAFGYNVVAEIRVTAFPTANKNQEGTEVKAEKRNSLSCQSLDKALSGISNPQLRSTLMALGGALHPPQATEATQDNITEKEHHHA